MRAIVVRHYKTLRNLADQILGWEDAPRVHGWEDDVAYVDACLHDQDIRFDAVYCSNLERARQTAMFHARRHGIQLINDHPELNEVNYGKLCRKKKKWVAEHFPLHKKDPDFVYPKGESFRQMQQRSVEFLTSLAVSRPRDTILVVVHAGVIRGFVSHFMGLDYADNLKRKISHRYIGDFLFEGASCVRYDELGKPSGFVQQAGLELPGRCPTATTPATADAVHLTG